MTSNFSKIQVDLGRYCDAWDLRDPKPVVEGSRAAIFTVVRKDGPAVLKIFTELGRQDEARSAAALSYFDGNGSVKILENDENALLLEYVEGPDLTELVKEGKDSEATIVIANTLNTLHFNCHPSTGNFPSLREYFSSLYECFGAETSEQSLFQSAVHVADRLLSDELDKVVLHGDIHHQNVLQSKTRGWLAIDPKGVYGERTYDAANSLFNPQIPSLVLDENRLLKTADILAARMRLPKDRLLAFAFVHGCLSAAWSIEDHEDPSLAISVAKLIQKHLVV